MFDIINLGYARNHGKDKPLLVEYLKIITEIQDDIRLRPL